MAGALGRLGIDLMDRFESWGRAVCVELVEIGFGQHGDNEPRICNDAGGGEEGVVPAGSSH